MSIASNSFSILMRCGYSEKEARAKSGYKGRYSVDDNREEFCFDGIFGEETPSCYEQIRSGFDNGNATTRRQTYKEFKKSK